MVERHKDRAHHSAVKTLSVCSTRHGFRNFHWVVPPVSSSSLLGSTQSRFQARWAEEVSRLKPIDWPESNFKHDGLFHKNQSYHFKSSQLQYLLFYLMSWKIWTWLTGPTRQREGALDPSTTFMKTVAKDGECFATLTYLSVAVVFALVGK